MRPCGPLLTARAAQAVTAKKTASKRGKGPSLKKKQQNLGGQFKASLATLVAGINETAVHYVRCTQPGCLANGQVSVCAARTLNAEGQSRVTPSLR